MLVKICYKTSLSEYKNLRVKPYYASQIVFNNSNTLYSTNPSNSESVHIPLASTTVANLLSIELKYRIPDNGRVWTSLRLGTYIDPMATVFYSSMHTYDPMGDIEYRDIFNPYYVLWNYLSNTGSISKDFGRTWDSITEFIGDKVVQDILIGYNVVGVWATDPLNLSNLYYADITHVGEPGATPLTWYVVPSSNALNQIYASCVVADGKAYVLGNRYYTNFTSPSYTALYEVNISNGGWYLSNTSSAWTKIADVSLTIGGPYANTLGRKAIKIMPISSTLVYVCSYNSTNLTNVNYQMSLKVWCIAKFGSSWYASSWNESTGNSLLVPYQFLRVEGALVINYMDTSNVWKFKTAVPPTSSSGSVSYTTKTAPALPNSETRFHYLTNDSGYASAYLPYFSYTDDELDKYDMKLYTGRITTYDLTRSSTTSFNWTTLRLSNLFSFNQQGVNWNSDADLTGFVDWRPLVIDRLEYNLVTARGVEGFILFPCGIVCSRNYESNAPQDWSNSSLYVHTVTDYGCKFLNFTTLDGSGYIALYTFLSQNVKEGAIMTKSGVTTFYQYTFLNNSSLAQSIDIQPRYSDGSLVKKIEDKSTALIVAGYRIRNQQNTLSYMVMGVYVYDNSFYTGIWSIDYSTATSFQQRWQWSSSYSSFTGMTLEQDLYDIRRYGMLYAGYVDGKNSALLAISKSTTSNITGDTTGIFVWFYDIPFWSSFTNAYQYTFFGSTRPIFHDILKISGENRALIAVEYKGSSVTNTRSIIVADINDATSSGYSNMWGGYGYLPMKFIGMQPGTRTVLISGSSNQSVQIGSATSLKSLYSSQMVNSMINIGFEYAAYQNYYFLIKPYPEETSKYTVYFSNEVDKITTQSTVNMKQCKMVEYDEKNEIFKEINKERLFGQGIEYDTNRYRIFSLNSFYSMGLVYGDYLLLIKDGRIFISATEGTTIDLPWTITHYNS